MKKIRVLQFPIRNSNGGITHYAMNNWKFMDKDKFECDFATVSKIIDFESTIIESGAGLKYIPCYAEDNEELFCETVNSILKNNYDVVHLHTSFWKSFLVEQIAIECKIPKIIVHSHSTRIDVDDDIKRVEAEKLHEIRKNEFNNSLATDFCACSKLAADWLFGPQIPREKIKILKNAIDIDRFLYNEQIRNKYRHELGLENDFVIGHVGRMAYQKNHEFLLDVFSDICKVITNAKLLLVGNGPLEEHIRNQAVQLGIIEKIVFAGNRNDVNNILQAMDVFALPSRFEGLPISLIEAQTSGLKCIAADTITDEVCITDNCVMLSLNKDSWVNAIIDMYHGYDRKNMSQVITDSGYNLKYQIKEIEKLYME